MSMEGKGKGVGGGGWGGTEINRPPLERLYEAALERSCISIERGLSSVRYRMVGVAEGEGQREMKGT